MRQRSLIRVAVLAVVLASAALSLTGCTAQSSVMGLTVTHGQITFVIPLCAADRVLTLTVYHYPSDVHSNRPVRDIWAIKAKAPSQNHNYLLGVVPVGFTQTQALRLWPAGDDVGAVARISYEPDYSFSATLYDSDLTKARPGKILAEGDYYSAAEFQYKFGTCKNPDTH